MRPCVYEGQLSRVDLAENRFQQAFSHDSLQRICSIVVGLGRPNDTVSHWKENSLINAIAELLGTSETNMCAVVDLIRKRYKAILREPIDATVNDEIQ